MMDYEDDGRDGLMEYVMEKASERGLDITQSSEYHLIGIIATDGMEYLDYHIRFVPIIPIGDDIFEVLDNPFLLSGEIDELSVLTQRIWDADVKESLDRLGITEDGLTYEEEKTVDGEEKTFQVLDGEQISKFDDIMDEILKERLNYWADNHEVEE